MKRRGARPAGALGGTVRWTWNRTPLWARLVAGALALVALALTVTGFIGISLLRDYLINQNGQQLRAFGSAVAEAHRYKPLSNGLNCGGLPNDNATELINASGQAHIVASCPAWVNGSTVLPELPSRTALSAAAQSGDSFILTNLTKPGLRWEAVVVPTLYHLAPSPPKHTNSLADAIQSAAGAGLPSATVTVPGYVLVATSLTDVDATVAQLSRLEIAIDSAVGAALIVLGSIIVRTALRPLTQIEAAAEAISAGDLSRRVSGGHPKTETGRLASALNGMLGQIEAAFSARERSEAAARDSERRMRQFVADASHELRTPLTSIRGFAELYRQGAADSRQMPDLIRRIEQEALRMGVLVEDLLLLARLDQQRPLSRDRVHLAALAAESITGARARQPSRLIELRVERACGAGQPVVIGDETRLRQALDNLLDNAMRHTPPDTRVSVRVRPSPDGVAEPGHYLLEVADTGPGMSEQAAGRVFERFYRADPARSRSATGDRGAGLGLAIVAAIAAAHGGKASVHTAPGQGAVFRLMLPAAPVQAESALDAEGTDADADIGVDADADTDICVDAEGEAAAGEAAEPEVDAVDSTALDPAP
ncbi:HAMP domain-containing histidine kinase [Actinocrinis puniceicyclus]|uniref:histidine kinase n=1 Tax=Actinocrinis puniceicyclus TaxID=977794 RepID=A0A8J7WS28_9ACTN|nr:HAMP domain-containing sensor histidine kinase [Actinocrinis puniceicyclus]MBS2965412.1 HAMP domain-containing histidine kinase [Actinocrinis puniceicyclus]